MRILFVTSTRIGDAVLSTGLMDHLVKAHPGCRITVACGPAAAPLFAEAPFIDRVIVMQKRRRSGHWVDLWRQTIFTRWDKTVDLRGSALTWLLRTNRHIVAGKGNGKEHRLVQLGRAMGLAEPPLPRIVVSEATRAKARTLMAGSQPIIALGPTANWWGKQWPAERFASAIARLTGRTGPLAGARIAVFGAPSERAMAEPLLGAMPKDLTIDLIGKVSLLEAFACLERATLFLGNDSGLMHLAAAAGVPTAGLFGPSPEAVYAPFGPRCIAVRGPRTYEEIVRAPDFDHLAPRSYMLDLSVDRVVEAVTALVAPPSAPAPPPEASAPAETSKAEAPQ
ncbi:MAG: glycosyltransferase family 9 protein [Alphaproteobacteria bacterium]|nr:glycosyltransferase family 9 protein [Alphaproteobacteria bacterium]